MKWCCQIQISISRFGHNSKFRHDSINMLCEEEMSKNYIQCTSKTLGQISQLSNTKNDVKLLLLTHSLITKLI
jgi:hypothetical protein